MIYGYYLNANIPVDLCSNKKEYLYDLKKHHGEVEDCIIFGVSHLSQVVAILFHALWKTVQYFIAYQLARLFKEVLSHPKKFHKTT